jgi:hypothetical protein
MGRLTGPRAPSSLPGFGRALPGEPVLALWPSPAGGLPATVRPLVTVRPVARLPELPAGLGSKNGSPVRPARFTACHCPDRTQFAIPNLRCSSRMAAPGTTPAASSCTPPGRFAVASINRNPFSHKPNWRPLMRLDLAGKYSGRRSRSC